jgi:hypothetical protein
MKQDYEAFVAALVGVAVVFLVCVLLSEVARWLRLI